MKKLLLIVCVIMCFALCACGTEKIVWNDIVLSDMLPEPPVNKGEVHTNSAEALWIDVSNLSDKQFNDYVKACKEKGFIVDVESNSFSYAAYNDEGYKLRLGHYGSDADMSIQLESPIEMGVITWPTSTAGKQLPTPKSSTGKFTYENDDNFFVYVGNTSRTDYAEYVNACSQKGFNVDYGKGDNYYYAYNSEGWHVDIRYIGNSVISIDIGAPNKGNSSSNTSLPSTNESSSNKDGISSDFKASMDSYEKFINEYVAFMKKYKANPTDLNLISDYSDYMSKYADFVVTFNGWEDKDLNSAEIAYYMDVQARVNKKLLEAAQ